MNFGGAEKGINTRKDYGKEVNSIARRGQGAMPLAESRGGASGRVWGNAPTVALLNQLKEKSQVGETSAEQRSAFSAAVVTLRVRRRAPKPLA